MSEASLVRPLSVFTLAMVAVLAALFAISQLVELPGGSSIGAFSLIAATLPAGQSFYKSVQRRATFGEKLTFAVLATVIVAALNLAALYALMTYYGVPFTRANIMTLFEVPTRDEGLFVKIILFAGLGITFCLTWIMFWAAIRGAEKQAAKVLR